MTFGRRFWLISFSARDVDEPRDSLLAPRGSRDSLRSLLRDRPGSRLCGNQPAQVASSGEEPAPPRHRAGVASMALRSTRRFRESLISPQAAGARSATRFAARSATRCTCPRGEVTAPRARRIPRSRSRGNPGPNPRPARTSTTSKHHTLTSTQYARARTIQFITRAPRARTRDTLSRRSRGASPSPIRRPRPIPVPSR